tara:strand:- start:517 stop:1167 length:651 start_codon:yes stop_codon:yes gene_type:complete
MKGGIADSNDKINKYLKSATYRVKYLHKNDFLSKYNNKHSQGIVIEFSGNIIKDFQIENFNKKNICYVIIDQINDPQNLGQIIRTCECAGIDGIILPKHGSVHITNTVLQVSQGSFENLDLFMVTNIKNIINQLKNSDFWIIGLENGINSKEWHQMDYRKKIAIVFGSESKGIRKLVKESCDFLATIPMQGITSSLNVSASISAIVFERQRQLNLD